jgi:EAL domain-containing protein (putative c-di-GMP-specific phosphodiesterase class I)
MRLENELNVKLAHANNEFINYYQPIVDARKGKTLGVELLMRWQSSTGLVGPYKFISIAEELGLIIEMTERALVRGLKDLQQWQKINPDFYLSINLSAKHFSQDDLVDFIRKQLAAFNIACQSLRIEVTESMFISEPEKAIEIMQSLSDLGVKLALDDFGTGYSSLAYLKQLPLDIIKLDRVFVSGLGENSADEAIVESTLVLARNLNMTCIAEGVETYAQRDYLLSKSCDVIQGFLYSKPVPADEIMPDIVLGVNKVVTSNSVNIA